MNSKERVRVLKLLALMAFALLLVWMLSGCATGPRAPYSEAELVKADQWVKSVKFLPDAQLQEECAMPERVWGCYSFFTGEMRILATQDAKLLDCIRRHERSHAYEVYVLGVSLADSQKHKRWRAPRCYPTPLFRPQPIQAMAQLP